LGAIFANIYTWRTFFLIYSSEDYVELARAKGLSSRSIDNRYVLRPVLPPILTSFLLILITMWLGQIVLETVFHWPGLGSIFYTATQVSDTPVILGIIVIFGYLLAATVFALDFVYAIIDPRVRVGGGAVRH
jgi:peptide/nickel transport system permease protein